MRFDLRKTLFILPNLFTLSSVFCGLYATLLCVRGSGDDALHRAALLIVFAMFFDIMDGRVARLTKTQSAFGVQIDSLADVVSFGVAPAVLVYEWSLHALDGLGVAFVFCFVACGAIRLARFNVLAMGQGGAPKRSPKYIIGLPIPGAAGILVSLVVANHAVSGHLPTLTPVVGGVVLALSFFMVSTVKFRSFKDLQLSWQTLSIVAFALTSSAIVAITTHVSFALVWLLGCYITIGLLETLFGLSRRLRSRTAETEEEQPSES